MPQILSGSDYLNQSAGVGALVLDKNDFAGDAIKTYNETTNYLNTWEKDKQQRDLINYNQFKNSLKDVDLNTDGIRPVSVDFFKSAQQGIYDKATQLLKKTSNPFDRNFLLGNNEMKNATKALQTMADADKQNQKHIKSSYEQANELAKQGKLDVEKTSKAIKDFSTLPIEEAVKLGTPQLVYTKGKGLNDLLREATDPKKNRDFEATKFARAEGGYNVEGEELTPERKMMGIEKAVNANPELQSALVEHYKKMPKEAWESVKRLSKDFNEAGYAPEIVLAYALSESPFTNYTKRDEDKFKLISESGKMEMRKESHKSNVKQKEKEYKYDYLAEQLANLATNNYANDREKGLTQTWLIGQPIGVDPDDVTNKIILTDYKVEEAPDGTINYYYKTNKDVVKDEKGNVIEDKGFRRTNNILDIMDYVLVNNMDLDGEAASTVKYLANEKLKKAGGSLRNAGSAKKYLAKTGQYTKFKPVKTEEKKEESTKTTQFKTPSKPLK